jgi:hypothetical protein
MSEASIALGRSRVVGFFVTCGLMVAMSLVKIFFLGVRPSMPFALWQLAFVFCSAAAAWYLYMAKKTGWHISLLSIGVWFLGLITRALTLNAFAVLVSAGMVVVLIWLFLPSVRAGFGMKV